MCKKKKKSAPDVNAVPNRITNNQKVYKKSKPRMQLVQSVTGLVSLEPRRPLTPYTVRPFAAAVLST